MCEQKTNVVELELEELALVSGGGSGQGSEPEVQKLAAASIIILPIKQPIEGDG